MTGAARVASECDCFERAAAWFAAFGPFRDDLPAPVMCKECEQKALAGPIDDATREPTP